MARVNACRDRSRVTDNPEVILAEHRSHHHFRLADDTEANKGPL